MKNIIIPVETREIIDMSIGHKAIHVEMLPSSGTAEIYQFHFTDQFNHITYKDAREIHRFNLKPWGDVTSKYCVLYTSKMLVPLKHWVYYVPSGSLITSSTVSLAPFAINLAECECGRCDEAKTGYNTLCSNTDYPLCGSNEDVLSQQFTSGVTDKCDEDETIEGACPEVEGSVDCCHLLKTTSLGTHEYKVRYPLLCGFAEGESTDKTTKQAKWYACSEKLKGETIYTATGNELKCNGNDWEVVKGDLSMQAARLSHKTNVGVAIAARLEFWLTNFGNDLNNVNITVEVMSTNFCGNRVTGSRCWGSDESYTVKNINLPQKSVYKFEYDNFCNPATDFEVNVSWSGGSKLFCINFKPSDCLWGSYAFPWEYEITEGTCA